MTELNNQPFFVIENESFDRMLFSLLNGEKFVKLYISTCPHRVKTDCKCLFSLNFLNQNGKMVRCSNGKLKRVIRQSELQQFLILKKSFHILKQLRN
jgi:hypothetical protein